jgi:YD repeat-containing protein
MRIITALCVVALVVFVCEAAAQTTTIYGSDGRAAARSTTDTQGTTTTYDARGNVVTRQSNGTLYGADGRSIGSVQTPTTDRSNKR